MQRVSRLLVHPSSSARRHLALCFASPLPAETLDSVQLHLLSLSKQTPDSTFTSTHRSYAFLLAIAAGHGKGRASWLIINEGIIAHTARISLERRRTREAIDYHT